MLVLEGSLPFRINVNRNEWRMAGTYPKDVRFQLMACLSFHVLKKLTEERHGATLGTNLREAFIL